MSVSNTVLGFAVVSGALAVSCGSGNSSGALPWQGPTPDPPPTGFAGAPSFAGSGNTADKPLFDGKNEQAKGLAPVLGGTLLATADGKYFVAADPDRNAVFVVDAGTRAVREITLAAGTEPGRVIDGAAGQALVVARRSGEVLALDLASASVTARKAVCASPRGIAYDAANARVFVTCRSGKLLTLGASDLALQRAITLDSDLRDVIVREKGLIVTRFMSSEVLVVSEDGTVEKREKPQPAPGCAEATVAYRAVSVGGGLVALAHQASSDEAVREEPGAYGSSSCGVGLVGRMLSVVNPDLPSTGSGSTFDPGLGVAKPSTMTFQTVGIPSSGPLDIAISPVSVRVAAIAFDNSLGGEASLGGPILKGLTSDSKSNLWLAPWSATAPADLRFGTQDTGKIVPGQPVAVVFDAQGKYVVQSREPATLELEDGSSIALSAASRADAGLRMFFMDSGLGVSCSSCHPEGGDDGHTWNLPEGLRRTMPLEGGLMERAPFHWDGSLPDMDALVNLVMKTRMALAANPSTAQIASMSAFLEQLPDLPTTDSLDTAAVARGQALFRRADVACATCHSGAQLTDNRFYDVGTGGKFVTPTLRGVGLRPSLFHDGCAKSIADRFGACGGVNHGRPDLLSVSEQADVIEYMRSL
jgi:DNA-binding beta-propeller fold protein YncE/mono/diheme cytochrome c family protein